MTLLPASTVSDAQTAEMMSILDGAALSVGMPAYTRLVADLMLERARFQDEVVQVALRLAQAEIRRLRITHAMAAADLRILRENVRCGRRSEALSLLELLLRDAEAGSVGAFTRPLPADVADLEQARSRRGGAA